MHSTMTGIRGVFREVFFIKDDKDRNIIGVVNVYQIKIFVSKRTKFVLYLEAAEFNVYLYSIFFI